jgi:hypothetical protein
MISGRLDSGCTESDGDDPIGARLGPNPGTRPGAARIRSVTVSPSGCRRGACGSPPRRGAWVGSGSFSPSGCRRGACGSPPRQGLGSVGGGSVPVGAESHGDHLRRGRRVGIGRGSVPVGTVVVHGFTSSVGASVRWGSFSPSGCRRAACAHLLGGGGSGRRVGPGGCRSARDHLLRKRRGECGRVQSQWVPRAGMPVTSLPVSAGGAGRQLCGHGSAGGTPPFPGHGERGRTRRRRPVRLELSVDLHPFGGTPPTGSTARKFGQTDATTRVVS